jgi:hypothetical protein
MLAEVFMLRLEVLLRASKEATTTSSDTRFVDIKGPVIPVKDGSNPSLQWRFPRAVGPADKLSVSSVVSPNTDCVVGMTTP